MTSPEPPVREIAVELPDGRQIGIADFGDGSDEATDDGSDLAVLWFHGTPGARRQVPPAAVEHAKSIGVRIIGVERPGIGWSTPHHYQHLIDWAEDIRHVCRTLGIDRFGVIGLSGGGPYALACAAALADHVVAAAILGGVAPSRGSEAPAGGIISYAKPFGPVLTLAREPMARAFSCTVRNILAPLAHPVFDLYVRYGPRSDREMLARPEMRAMFMDDLLSAAHHQLKGLVYDAVLFTRHWGFDIADIEVPLFFWHGDADFFVPLAHGQHMAELAKNGTLHFRPGDGHLATLDASCEALDLFVSEHRERDARHRVPWS